ncbi:type VI secretion system contractile sheath small subunit, partial [Vibrio parahaemolyticus]|nr:type VI secretion system contractile sheath small subunit [Vibrio parahaemolyticus]
IVNQVDPLRQLMETRNKLRDLMTKVDRSEELENILEDVLNNTDNLARLAGELDLDKKAKSDSTEGAE